jgi:hypothetical protein
MSTGPSPLVLVRIASAADDQFAHEIACEMERSAHARGTGIARRSAAFLAEKMYAGDAVIAVCSTGKWAGFCYQDSWGEGAFVVHSGLIINPAFRGIGLAKAIKKRIFQCSRAQYPDASIVGLTTGKAVMKINSDLGYVPVTYSDLPSADAFWSNCQSCVNYSILQSKERKNCLCTAMLFAPPRPAASQSANRPNTQILTE